MENIIKGTAHVFGDNIDTDQIYPGRWLDLVEPDEIAPHCLEGVDESFSRRCRPGDVVAAGTNFGCGSSREHAAIALKTTGVGAVVAKSFARIFYRNAINMGLLIVVCPDIDRVAHPGETLRVDLVRGTVSNERGETARFLPISDYALKILEAGGIKAFLLQEA
jgi:3-isopropylmalate/(R)-2-methylmalate dehydratase small subunit